MPLSTAALMGKFAKLVAMAKKQASRDKKRGVVPIGGRWNNPNYPMGFVAAAMAPVSFILSEPVPVTRR